MYVLHVERSSESKLIQFRCRSTTYPAHTHTWHLTVHSRLFPIHDSLWMALETGKWSYDTFFISCFNYTLYFLFRDSCFVELFVVVLVITVYFSGIIINFNILFCIYSFLVDFCWRMCIFTERYFILLDIYSSTMMVSVQCFCPKWYLVEIPKNVTDVGFDRE